MRHEWCVDDPSQGLHRWRCDGTHRWHGLSGSGRQHFRLLARHLVQALLKPLLSSSLAFSTCICGVCPLRRTAQQVWGSLLGRAQDSTSPPTAFRPTRGL
jgi:hypothetical protein